MFDVFKLILGLVAFAAKPPSYGPIRCGRPIRNQPPPNNAGHYRFRNKETGDVDYYGTTNSLRRRHAEHRRGGHFNSDHHFEWQPANKGVSADDLYKHEKKKIKEHAPPLNKRNGGAGPRWVPKQKRPPPVGDGPC